MEAPPSMESVGWPPIVTAARSQSVRRYPGEGSLLSKEAQELEIKQAKLSHRT